MPLVYFFLYIITSFGMEGNNKKLWKQNKNIWKKCFHLPNDMDHKHMQINQNTKHFYFFLLFILSEEEVMMTFVST